MIRLLKQKDPKAKLNKHITRVWNNEAISPPSAAITRVTLIIQHKYESAMKTITDAATVDST